MPAFTGMGVEAADQQAGLRYAKALLQFALQDVQAVNK